MLLLLIVEFSRHISLKALIKMLDNWNSKERCDKCGNQLSHECYSHNVCWRKSILLWRTNVWLTAGCPHSCKSSTWASFTSTETTKVQPWHPAVKRNASGLMQVFFFSLSPAMKRERLEIYQHAAPPQGELIYSSYHRTSLQSPTLTCL